MTPWDKRLARRLARALAGTGIRPNHVTLCSLLCGLCAGALFAAGPGWSPHVGAGTFMFAMFLDHLDGELARATGTSSRFGHAIDRLTSLSNYVVLFVGIGAGLSEDPRLGTVAPWLGVIAGLAVGAIFGAREWVGRHRGDAAIALPSAGGFEVEDVMYAVGPITWIGGLAPFLAAAAIGAPAFLAWSALRRGPLETGERS